MALVLFVESVIPGVDANRIRLLFTPVAGSGLVLSVTATDFNRIVIEIEAGVDSTDSVADAINGDTAASAYITASGPMIGSQGAIFADYFRLSGGLAGGGEGQYYSGAARRLVHPEFLRAIE